MPIGRDSARTGADEEVCTYVEFRDYDPRTNIEKRKKRIKTGRIKFKGENL